MEKRTDHRTAILVDAAINSAVICGPIAAAKELFELGVPLDIAIRVLTRPNERRRYQVMQQPASPA